jgi:hypothetical protein
MTEQTATALAARPTASNCCNGRVGREMMELAQQVEIVARMVEPTGATLIKASVDAGLRADLTSNCCNGRVGRNLAEEVITAFSGG